MENLVKELCSCEGDDKVLELVSQKLQDFGKVTVDRNKNIIANITSESGKKHIVLDAHLDTIHLVVTHIDDNGFISFAASGGVDAKYLPGQVVKILAKETITAIITTIPPHASKLMGKEKVDIDSLYIDTGLSSDRVKNLVSPGDRVIFADKPTTLLNSNLASPALDDRAGIAAILACLGKLKGKNLPVELSVVFSQHEETTGGGAKTAAFSIKPDEAIVVDVSFAVQHQVQNGVYAKLGEGIIIGTSPTLSPCMTENLKQLASEKNIPYTIEAMGGKTSTNADSFTLSRNGVACANLFIPLRYMHSPVEVVNLKDIERVSELLYEYVMNYKEEN